MGGGGCSDEPDCIAEDKRRWEIAEEKRKLDLEEQRLRIATMKKQLAETHQARAEENE